MVEFLVEIPLNKKITEITNLFINRPDLELHYQDNDFEFIAWADPIATNGFKKGLVKNPDSNFILDNLCGHYYYILLNKYKEEIFIGNSMFSILPLYYFQNSERIVLSENSLKLGKYLNINKISQGFILETLLFNYPLFNSSIIEDINLLSSNSYFKIEGAKISLIKHTRIADYLPSTPKQWRSSVSDIRDFFLEATEKYLPDKPYIHSLTGGFDGRTLVSAGLYNHKEFSCYCFGSTDSKDTKIAEQLTVEAGVPFINIDLNEKYIRADSIENGKEFIVNSSGTATFARAHYLFAAKYLSGKAEHIITGNFGSEIFRAAHNSGEVISSNLYSLFNSANIKAGIAAIENSQEFGCLNMMNCKNSWETLKEQLFHLTCYNNEYSDLTKNQKFYLFVFEEIFRKYFGAEIINQFKYLKNRTPFLDIEFLKAILKTELAGIHSNFFENNPFKRYKGQVLYASIIRKAYPEFGKMRTDKGYKPDDLLNFFGKVNVAKGYFKKIIQKSAAGYDPNSVVKAWESNKIEWIKIPVSEDLFNSGLHNSSTCKEIKFKIISLSYAMNILK